MDASDLDYDLPSHLIAQEPLGQRDQAQMLVDRGPQMAPGHRHVHDLPELLEPGDLLVLNDTRVRPARLRLRRPTGGAAEVLLLEPRGATGDGATAQWEALVRPGKKLPPGTQLVSDPPSGHDQMVVVVGHHLGDGRRLVEVVAGDPDQVGEMPLPPYIHTRLADGERYQTVYSQRPASAAAPTAGLHLTTDVLERCQHRGIDIAMVELVVGLDTFRPIASAKVEDHPIHTEWFRVPPATASAISATRAKGAKVVAVGTTVVRSVETWAATGQTEGRTNLFIRPGFSFQAVDRMLTNFHVPRTTLLALVAAFVGQHHWRDLYAVALAEEYRFLSFGDCMLLTRHDLARSIDAPQC